MSENQRDNHGIMISNIQRMCFHDGPGIRTTVFMKGCTLHCPWCSNPENISFEPQIYSLDGKEGIYGEEYDKDSLLTVLAKDRIFWGSEGGVTFSGGEPLAHLHSLYDVLSELRKDKIHISVETSLFVPDTMIDLALRFVDYFIIDVKILNNELCKNVLGGDIDQYYRNVNWLYNSDKELLFRIPCNYEYTFSEQNKDDIKSFLNSYKDIPVQLFAIHNLGETKYRSLGKDLWSHKKISNSDLGCFVDELTRQGNIASIIDF